MAEALCRLSRERGGAIGPRDLAAYRVNELEPRHAGFVDRTVHLRGNDLDHTADTLERLDAILRAEPEIETPVAVVRALGGGGDRDGDTSNCAAVDSFGNACAVTTSLGLGAGEWWPGYGVHLNSMLGEGELLRGDLTPGERMGSMMTPLVVTDALGPVLAGGAAGASRIRSALAQVLTRVLRDGTPPQEAVDAPRLNPVPGPRIHCEPGLPERALDALRETGAEVVVWPERHSYFGGVSLVAEGGPAADPRRGGGTGVLP
jgi:gamma-glutamyltranspeptidase/glutathione hydrolase